jgi:arylsulfatase A-like enzyme
MRVSYMGNTDEGATHLLVSLFWPLILLMQAKIVAVLLVASTLFWAWGRFGLGLGRRGAAVAGGLLWLGVTLSHARTWPAPYSDLHDIRPIPDALLRSLLEGWAGWAAMGIGAAVIGVMVLRQGTPARTRQAVAAAAAVVVVLAAGALPTLPAWERQPVAEGLPDVLVLASDSWRADHFECRADSTLTPKLGALCERLGTVHPASYTAQPRTFGGLVSVFTGMSPDESGVTHMMVRGPKRQIADKSLVPRFAELGYRTVAVSGYAGDVFPRVNLGFEEVHANKFGFESVVGEFCLRWHPLIWPLLATNRFGRWLAPRFRGFPDLADPVLEASDAVRRANEDDPRPLFLTVFLSATHNPYPGRRGAAWRRGDDTGAGRYRWWNAPAHANHLDQALIETVRHRYADAVQLTDEVLGSIAEQALGRGNTIVVLISDHGELLYEFGEGVHGDHLYGGQQSEVPLVILDGRAGAARPAPVGPLHAIRDALPAVLAAVETGGPVAIRGRDHLFLQSGITLLAFNEALIKGRGGQYPRMLGLLQVDRSIGDVVVQPRWDEVVELQKFRGLVTPEWLFVYAPGCRGPRMAMFPRDEQIRASPEYSIHDEHPAEVEQAWSMMEAHWGKTLVSRACRDGVVH